MKEIIKPNLRKYSLVLILLGMIGICSILSSSFLTATNFTNILKQVSIVTICAFAQGLIIISGEIDLSIGFLAGMAGSFACIMFVATGNLFLAFMFGLLLGATVGAVNGLFVAYFKLPSFIVTLAMQTVCFGIICLYTGGQNIYKIGNFKVLGQSKLLGIIPITVFFMIVMLVITHILLKYTKFGRYLYAIGGNAEAANAAGVQVCKMKWAAFIVSGLFAAIAGMVMMGRLNAGIPSEGGGYETDAITATVIGGTSFSGGAGTAFGTFLGSLIIGVLNNIMNLLGIDSYLQMIIKGFIIIIAVLADSFSKKQKSSIKIMASTFDVKK
ncbi:monosaccharide ABC transporter membrane protein (CUT2 family) [Lachnotalea glycerini]|uniref:ABC transporter permease n=1 Tax=Lachnotalea glycerini TaxID=1763509 RepID=A0A318EVJ8_9FIRM|nr:ABC transporter permease [Lachnotalea glycerini]PXV95503.1 monosaccharide ABC transporter membrane protein (CUT2 family) [Lachnotalea glycerini]RDY32823.1 ABC transporter permease [Lachnotalea glycerini]